MKLRVMFLCSGNSARSQMAEGYLSDVAGDRFNVVSAGTGPGSLNPLAVRVIREVGIDISGQRSKPLADFLGRHFGYLITVCERAREKCPIFPGAVKRIDWPVADPAAATGTEMDRLAAFRRARDDIAARVDGFLSDEVSP